MENEAAWGMMFVLGLMLIFATVLIVVIWQVFTSRRANAELARDDAYRKLAERATSAQERAADDLADLRQRVARIEQVLKEVE